MQSHATDQIPDDVLRVTEPELQEKLPVFLDRVAHAEEELVVLRDGEPIAARPSTPPMLADGFGI